MRLSKRAKASRANGALSRGPKTPEGKRRSSANALRHGLLSQCVVLQNESNDTFNLLLQQHLDKLNPADDIECGMVEEMAAASWRLRRLWAIETNLFDSTVARRTEPTERARIAAAFSALSATNELGLLDRYESRLHRMYQRSLANFLVLRQVGTPAIDSDLAHEPIEIPLLPNEPRSEQPVPILELTGESPAAYSPRAEDPDLAPDLAKDLAKDQIDPAYCQTNLDSNNPFEFYRLQEKS